MMPYTPYAISISLTPYVLLLELVLAACVAYLLVAIASDRKRIRMTAEARRPDRLLRKRLTHSRMVKMLRRLNVDPAVYLRRTPADDIESQLDTCSSCAHQLLCDPALASDKSASVDLSFCPNRPSILSLVRSTT